MKHRRGEAVRSDDADAELAARAAWLYHVGGFLQAEVARQLGMSLFKVNRLIAYAAEHGIVRVVVEGPIAGCVELEQRIKIRFGLGFVRVVPDLGETALPLQALGVAAASYLDAVLDGGRHRVIGVGHGRALAALSREIPVRRTGNVQFVTLLGSLPSRFSGHPFEVAYSLADRVPGSVHLIPVPLYANDAEDRAVLMRQAGVRRAFEMATQASLCLLGIASVADKAKTDLRMETIGADDLAEVQRTGAVAEILGQYYDAAGCKVATSLHERVIAFAPEALREREAVGVAGGEHKAGAILAVLRAKLLTGLITTDSTAIELLAAARPPDEIRLASL